MLSPWLTAASTRLRGRSQKTPVGSKGVGAEVLGGAAVVLDTLESTADKRGPVVVVA
jgi:hypothetical protein